VQEETNPDTLLALLLCLDFLLLERRKSPLHSRSLYSRDRRLCLGTDLQWLILSNIFQNLYTFICIRFILTQTKSTSVETFLDSTKFMLDHGSLRGCTGDHGSKQHGEEHEMVVLNPDHVTG
jgi:hypothetical protein